jgi:thiol-disulfide isomerase/thioredoxin
MSSKYINANSYAGLNKIPLGSEGLFSKMKIAGGNMSSSTFMIIITVVLFSVLAGLYFFYYVLPGMKATYRPNSEQVPIGSSSSSNAELLFFYADWCPHCKTAKPIWNDLKEEYENKTINGYRVIFTEIDCSTDTAESEQMMNKYKVEGFPTIKLIKDGQVIEYDAKPSKETLVQYLNTVL